MDRSQITDLLNILKTTTDKSILLRGLHKLRTEVVKNYEGITAFREAKGIPIMIKFLGKPKEEVLEIALSILANCCSYKECCNEAFESRVLVNLLSILKAIPNPVIQCRACRLLGNLAKADATQLLQSGSASLAKTLSQIFEETSDVNTRIMAIRATRYLIGYTHFLQNILHANGFTIILQLLTGIMRKTTTQQEDLEEKPPIRTGLKLNQHREKYFEEVARSLESVRSDIFDREISKHSEHLQTLYEMPTDQAAELCSEIIKCLSIMSEKQMNLHVWNGLTHKGCNLSTVGFLASESSKFRTLALRILANFSKNHSACYVLSNSNAVTTACDLLLSADMEKPLTEYETRYCLNILGNLSVDACNRSKIRRSGAIRKLIIMLRELKSQTEMFCILQLLNNFQYDNMSMELMLREGLISVLIRELYNYLTCDDDYHKKRREERQERSKKRKLKNEELEQPNPKIGRLSDDYVCDFESPSCSPKPTFLNNSPCSSRSMSPLFVGGNGDEASNDGETYSPICSDDEEDSDNGHESQEKDTTDIMKLLDAISTRSPVNTDDEKDDEEFTQDAPPLKSFGNMPRSAIDIIENLIFRITLLVNKRAELGKAETISTLIKAINTFGANNNFVAALMNILVESQFFAQTVKFGIAHQIYQLTKKEETRTDGFAFLDTLTSVGESNYGQGELVRLVRSDNMNFQRRAAIAVAYIIRNRKILLQFLNEGNALNILLDIILYAELDDELLAEAADALTSLSQHTLSITVPVDIDESIDFRIVKIVDEKLRIDADDSDEEILDYDMRFRLYESDNADPIVIHFNKQLLCDSSDVFDTMFHSSFREGNENEVRLHNYTVNGLKYFLKLIVLTTRKQQTYTLPSMKEHYALLEAYEMSRIYNLPPIETIGRRMLIQLLDEQNCLQVLQWSMRNNHPELMEYAVNYYLCSSLNPMNKIKLFRATKAADCATEWLQMLTEAIICRCQNGL